MSYVNITNVQFPENPSLFTSNIKMQVSFECLKNINDPIEWELIYIGSSKDESYDQVLDKFEMGPLEIGQMSFNVESNAPDHTKIPTKEDLLGVSAIILSVSYKKQEFFRVGYYVYNYYNDPALIENDPPQVLINQVYRNILHDKPRITRFDIKWENDEYLMQFQQQNKVLEKNVLQDLTNSQFMQNSMPQDIFSKSNGIFNQLGQIPSFAQMFGQDCSIPFCNNNINNQKQSQQQFSFNSNQQQQQQQQGIQSNQSFQQYYQNSIQNQNQNQNFFCSNNNQLIGNQIFQPTVQSNLYQ